MVEIEEIEEINFKLSGKEAERDEKVNSWGGFDVGGLVERNKLTLLVAILGLILIFAGAFLLLKKESPQDKIEIITSELSEQEEKKKILVDIEGAVVKPGVFELPSGSRIKDLLIAAGGLNQEADREWVEKTLNLAQKLEDGTKIYIPNRGEQVKGSTSSKNITGATGGSSGLININTATKTELEALWGIGPVTAQKIIDSRPYQAVDDFLTKKIVPRNVYQKIVEQLSIW